MIDRPGAAIHITRVLAGVFAAAAAVGCGTSTQTIPTAPATNAPTTSTTAPATTIAATTAPSTTSATAISTVPTTAPPPSTAPANQPTNTELIAILEALYLRTDALYADPANADLSVVCAAGSSCEQTYGAQLGDMASRGEHLEGVQPTVIKEIVAVTDLGLAPGSSFDVGLAFEVEFDIVLPDQMGRIANAQGDTVAELILGDDVPVRFTRIIVSNTLDVDLPWRFAD